MNRLAQESSPYLRQHANNPVDWYPWGDEALKRAQAENKPILLSVGYSACHWCHVMEHESFENAEIAKLMNEHFVSIKVDREERPDLDQIYQNVAQLMTHSGGWPLTVFLTPDLRPFYGGTYFPPEDRYGRPGFPRVLTALAEAFHKEPQSIAENATKLMEAIAKLENPAAEQNTRPDQAALKKAADAMISDIDWKNGGFGGAPKFPNTMNLSFLWRLGVATDFGMAQEAVVMSLAHMARGGIYDHLGGGFHRYSVDAMWRVPHFEKMLYDNAVLMKLYAEVLLSAEGAAFTPIDRALFVTALSETVQWTLREMRSPEGGFYSTQDADSEGEEGKFFVWDPRSVAAVVSSDEARAFCLRYGVTEEGNFEHSNQTVLEHARTAEQVASEIGTSAEQVEKLISSARQKLFNAREKRAHPARDEKILAGWNGLMISGLAWAATALRANERGDLAQEAQESARVAMEFVRTHLTRDGDRLFTVYKDGKARLNAYLDDYAFLAMAALDLARFAEDETAVDTLNIQARKWVDVARTRFVDRASGGFYFTSDDHEKLIQRPKTLFDQAIPSGNAVLVECMLALAEVSADATYATEADEHLYRLFPAMLRAPQGLGELACAALLFVQGPVAVSGPAVEATCDHPHAFRKYAPEAHEILVCHRATCDLPLTNAQDARRLVRKKQRLLS